MNIAAIRATFADEWVVAKVAKTDKEAASLAGKIIVHSPEKQRVYQEAKTYLALHPATRLFIFFTGDLIPQNIMSVLRQFRITLESDAASITC
jgi:hypothetical protein